MRICPDSADHPLLAALAADKPFGLERRLPGTTRAWSVHPTQCLPTRSCAFPKLSIKQPLVLTPNEGLTVFSSPPAPECLGRAGLLAVPDRQDVTAADAKMLIEIDGLAIGFALHPDYQRNGYIYFGLNGPIRRRPKTTQVVRYTVNRQAPHGIDPMSKLLIIEWASDGHDGGDLAFGNDGFLYVSSGDGSSGSDAHMTGQRIDDLRCSAPRIDVDHPDPGRNYSVPKDNPFVDRKGARPELWAYGSQPLAAELRPRVRPALGRPERTSGSKFT